ncbi:hypothetical protein MUK42_17320 [Musa troglodytarum]|uniref:Uncharacterized protein n=1 Tax=Musa troglodytarum TaxID=320322 RepID=A0A9E7I2E9_9LILI|nr:hypothetical protein MUK42_17320 [Musa troglodytarum]
MSRTYGFNTSIISRLLDINLSSHIIIFDTYLVIFDALNLSIPLQHLEFYSFNLSIPQTDTLEAFTRKIAVHPRRFHLQVRLPIGSNASTSPGAALSLPPAASPTANSNPNSSPPLENELPDPPSPESSANPHPPAGAVADKRQRLFDLLVGVLAELFVVGESPVVQALKAKKGAPKQPNPRVCISSPSASIDGYRAPPATSPPSSADNSVADATKNRRKRSTAAFPVDLDSSACSRTDVTVIDTSCPGWKSEKLILRKGATWKVRDKKVWTLIRKKTKLGVAPKLVNEKEKEQPLADPKVLAEDVLLASLVEAVDERDASEKKGDQFPISIRRQVCLGQTRITSSGWLLFFSRDCDLRQGYPMVASSNLIGPSSFISTGL